VAGRVVMAAVVHFQAGGGEAAPIEGDERRRRPRDIRSRAEEVAGVAQRRVAWPAERRR
jgi:hypothetical protein